MIRYIKSEETRLGFDIGFPSVWSFRIVRFFPPIFSFSCVQGLVFTGFTQRRQFVGSTMREVGRTCFPVSVKTLQMFPPPFSGYGKGQGTQWSGQSDRDGTQEGWVPRRTRVYNSGERHKERSEKGEVEENYWVSGWVGVWREYRVKEETRLLC